MAYVAALDVLERRIPVASLYLPNSGLGVGTCLFCSRYWAFWIWSWVPLMVIMRSSEPSRGSSILIEAPDSWRICLIRWPALPMIEPAIYMKVRVVEQKEGQDSCQ